MIEIFSNIKEKNFLIGIKLENINFLKFNQHIEIFCNSTLFNQKEKIILNNLTEKDVKFIDSPNKHILPYPVRNSKYNNFVLLYNGLNLIYFQKNKPFNREIFEIKSSPIELAKKISLKKLPFLEENYKYLQLVFIWDKIYSMKKYYYEWNNFLEKENIKKFIGNIFYSYFMEVGYEPSS